jgi:CRISPR-associated protein Cas2
LDILIAYDVTTETKERQRRLRKVAQVCQDFGQRVQKSVFECSVNDMQLVLLRQRLLACMHPDEDSLRIYRLVGPRDRHVEAHGNNLYVDFDDPLVV